MNYLEVLDELCAYLGQDKGITQPYRNYAVSDAKRLMAVIKMGMTTTNLSAPSESDMLASDDNLCTCRKDQNGNLIALRKSCPTHGQEAASLIAAKQNTANSN